VFSDVKIALDANSNGVVDGFRVPIRNTADYSPFGVQLDGRTIQGDFYRRGFNGMEKDDEVKGGGNSYDFGARMYDSRVGRWLTRDPHASKYPDLSPYNFVANSPLIFIDPDGKDIIIVDPVSKKEYLYQPNSTKIEEDMSEFVTTTIHTLDNIINKGWDSEFNMITKMSSDQTNIVTIKFQPEWKKGAGSVNGLIPWNPNSGLSQKEGEKEIRQSPAHTLFHELGHLFYLMLDPYNEIKNTPKIAVGEEAEKFFTENEKLAGEFHDLSDKWIITELEKNIDEPVRTTHGENGVNKERFFTCDQFGLDGPKASEVETNPTKIEDEKK
jgi:RHS repeat-associated protein